MKILIASDHAGFELKEEIKKYLTKKPGYEVVDYGPDSTAPVDYPDFAKEVAKRISSGEAEKGVLICGSGTGMAIAANRFKGVRAAVIREEFDAEMSRLHNNSNIACFSARVTAFDRCLKLLDLWLKTPFEGGRHTRRVEKIDQ